MVAHSWVMRACPEAKAKVEKWLKDEQVQGYVLVPTTEAVEVDFVNINDAFRFRLQFDEELV